MFITKFQLNTFLCQENIFMRIYGPDMHPNLMEAYEDVIGYLLQEDILNLRDPDVLWRAITKEDRRTKLQISKVMSRSPLHFQSFQFDHIILEVLEIFPEYITDEEIELILVLYNSPAEKPANSMKVTWDLCWDTTIIGNTKVYSMLSRELPSKK